MGGDKETLSTEVTMGRIDFAVGFSGRIKSGKTSMARRVAEELSLPLVSFGNFVRSNAVKQGKDSTSRDVLQALGESLIRDLGWHQFCLDVLAGAGWAEGQAVVIDGIRHVDVLRELKGILNPVELMLVYVEITSNVQDERYSRMDGSTPLKQAVVHSTEADVESLLKQEADLVLDGADEFELSFSKALNFLSRR